jgi:hypothetical protein
MACAAAIAADSKPGGGPEVDEVSQWIEDLGNPSFEIRELAEAELAALGFAAFDALTVAEESDDLEISQRARFLLRSMTASWVRESDPPEVKKLLEGYEQQTEVGRNDILQRLALMPDDAGVNALCRLARYEKSPLYSKRAALEVMFRRSRADQPTRGARRPSSARLARAPARRPPG